MKVLHRISLKASGVDEHCIISRKGFSMKKIIMSLDVEFMSYQEHLIDEITATESTVKESKGDGFEYVIS